MRPSLSPSVRARSARLHELTQGSFVRERERPTWVGRCLRALGASGLLGLSVVRLPLYLIAVMVLALVITLPMGDNEQLALVIALFGVTWWLRSQHGRAVRLALILLSLTISLRYMYWRVTETLFWTRPGDAVLGLLLLAAELYAVAVLALGYFQVAWPLNRRPVALVPDETNWPTVDVFIPSYNEPLSVVGPTVLAALDMDYPLDKFRVYVLDDGKRPEFEGFCRSVGAHWITRSDNRHAKAGNINHALSMTDGEYFAVFDCDHIPTRSFLQLTLGAMIADPRLAMVQTPHHFFSSDPMEKNLSTFRDVPNEGELFYGLIQDGNDLWNASFFCGSCAVLRREPVMDVGGIAVETVTEDAHTALKLHRKGLSTAYLAIPQAAGLATDTLAAHVGQRIRWARGMAQIFRIDNPLFGRGLNLAQRLCYLNTMLHFFNGIPRLVYLTAPLAFLFFRVQVINASAWSIALFALPHLVFSNMVNSKIQRQYRHSFWGEVYETVLAWYIMRPTTVALLSPSKGKFNVTAKGGLSSSEYFSWTIAAPYLVLALLNVGGVLLGLFQWRMVSGSEADTIALNLIWTVYNLLIIGASLASACEVRQRRQTHRVTRTLAATVRFSDGESLACETLDFSFGGLGLTMPRDIDSAIRSRLVHGERVHVSLYLDDEETAFPVEIRFFDGKRLGVQFDGLSPAEQQQLVRCTFARADAWVEWADGRRHDRPLRSLARVFSVGMFGWTRLVRHLLRRHSDPVEGHDAHTALEKT